MKYILLDQIPIPQLVDLTKGRDKTPPLRHVSPVEEWPELDPVENIWRFVRDNWLSNCIFNSYDDHCCAAWNKFVDQPWPIMSIRLRQWAHVS